MRPTVPAFALCVWTIRGLSCQSWRKSLAMTSTSRRFTSRLISGMTTGSTPAARAK
jgi:hypothetical protein